jgi:hypothetical protein
VGGRGESKCLTCRLGRAGPRGVINRWGIGNTVA